MYFWSIFHWLLWHNKDKINYCSTCPYFLVGYTFCLEHIWTLCSTFGAFRVRILKLKIRVTWSLRVLLCSFIYGLEHIYWFLAIFVVHWRLGLWMVDPPPYILFVALGYKVGWLKKLMYATMLLSVRMEIWFEFSLCEIEMHNEFFIAWLFWAILNAIISIFVAVLGHSWLVRF